MNQHNNRTGLTGDQSALSLLVNAADSRDGPRGQQRDANGAMSRTLVDTLRLRGLTGENGPTLEEQLYLQQQSQGSYGGQGNFGFLNQLRDQNMLLSQLGQQQQLASLLGLGGGSSQSQDMRQALAAAQMRQNQAAPHLTNADILALTRSGALSGLSNILGAGLGGNQGGVGFGGSGHGSGYPAAGTHGLASELDGLQRLEELERRRLLAATAEVRGTASPAVGRVESSMPEHSAEQNVQPRTDASLSSKFKSAQSPVVEAAAAPETTKEELEKTPGSVIVPCRARGMPMDHNFKTAFFVIPENVKHGEELICSYFACRNAGIKFRYCSHCKVPVAKRNFRKRHKHGDDNFARGGDDDSVGDDCVPAKKGIPSQITASRDETEEADGISSQSADSTNLQDSKHGSEADAPQVPVRNTMRTSEVVKEDKPSDPYAFQETALDGKISKERRQRWVDLLAKRPSTKDGDSMSGWLMEVLAVSDLETPLKPNDNVEETGKTKAAKKKDESPKKHLERNSNDSHTSDAENSSKDDSVHNDIRKESKEKNIPGAFNSGIVKKKRPAAELLRDSSDQPKAKSSSFVRGSFAEWKERKKQKKQTKTGGEQNDA